MEVEEFTDLGAELIVLGVEFQLRRPVPGISR
ncbi:MAG: hypothetical protein QOD10_4858, partial [Mycobacterium sp.]|nr:hypothetical protein [Mycobacterium sp.]